MHVNKKNFFLSSADKKYIISKIILDSQIAWIQGRSDARGPTLVVSSCDMVTFLLFEIQYLCVYIDAETNPVLLIKKCRSLHKT